MILAVKVKGKDGNNNKCTQKSTPFNRNKWKVEREIEMDKDERRRTQSQSFKPYKQDGTYDTHKSF
jgi:hypothetical protein